MFRAKWIFPSSLALSIALIGPALAQNEGGSSDAAGAQQVLLAAAHDIRELRSNPRFAKLLEKSKGVFVVPHLVKGAFGFGASGGTGVLVAHENGYWSNPAFVTLGSFSFGLQAGGDAGPFVLFPMTDKDVTNLTEPSSLFFYGDAGIVVGAWSSDARWPITENNLVAWSGENGGFAGLVLAGADTHDKTIYDKAYYSNEYTEAKQIIGSRGDPNAAALLSELPG